MSQHFPRGGESDWFTTYSTSYPQKWHSLIGEWNFHHMMKQDIVIFLLVGFGVVDYDVVRSADWRVVR